MTHSSWEKNYGSWFIVYKVQKIWYNVTYNHPSKPCVALKSYNCNCYSFLCQYYGRLSEPISEKVSTDTRNRLVKEKNKLCRLYTVTVNC